MPTRNTLLQKEWRPLVVGRQEGVSGPPALPPWWGCSRAAPSGLNGPGSTRAHPAAAGAAAGRDAGHPQGLG